MNEEQIKQKADMYIKDFHDTELSETDLVLFASQLVYEETKELQEENLKLESKIKHLTEHLEPQAMTVLFEQVEEEVKQEQRIKQLEKQIERMKRCEICANSKDWRNRSLCIACEKSESHINFVLRR